MATRHTTQNEADARNAQDKISGLLKEAEVALKNAQTLADQYGLSFSFDGTDSSGGGLTYYGREGGGRFSLEGEWYTSTC